MTIIVDGSHIGKPLILWDPTSRPGMLINGGKWLGNHLCQVPQRPQMDPIWPYELVTDQVEQQNSQSFHLNYGGLFCSQSQSSRIGGRVLKTDVKKEIGRAHV